MGTILRIFFTILMLCFFTKQVAAGEVSDVVLQFADSFAKSHPSENSLPADAVVSTEYARWFFQGFTHPSGGIFTKSDLMRDAYTNGQIYWRDHPSERVKIFAQYGYLPVELDGVWSKGFEKSTFQANAPDAGTWWMDSIGGVAWPEVGLDSPNLASDRVYVAGYLSPKGQYGHLGAYEHEVLVTSGRRIDPATPGPDSADDSFVRGRAAYSPAMTQSLLKRVGAYCTNADKSAPRRLTRVSRPNLIICSTNTSRRTHQKAGPARHSFAARTQE